MKSGNENAQYIVELAWNFTSSRLLVTAIELDIFTHISNGYNSQDKLMEKIGCQREMALQVFLNALVSFRLLSKCEEQFDLPLVAQRFLVKDSPEYLGSMIMEVKKEWDAWADLTRIVREGTPYRTIENQEFGEDFFASMLDGLFRVSWHPAQLLSDTLGIGKTRRKQRILDLGAGSAPWSIAMAMDDQEAQLTLVDWPAALNEARLKAKEFGVGERVREIPEDAVKVEFGHENYDIVILGHFLRLLSKEQAQILLDKAKKALMPGGIVAIMEFISNDKVGSFSNSVALNLLINTSKGSLYSLDQLSNSLEIAGYKKKEILKNIAPYPIVIGIK